MVRPIRATEGATATDYSGGVGAPACSVPKQESRARRSELPDANRVPEGGFLGIQVPTLPVTPSGTPRGGLAPSAMLPASRWESHGGGNPMPADAGLRPEAEHLRAEAAAPPAPVSHAIRRTRDSSGARASETEAGISGDGETDENSRCPHAERAELERRDRRSEPPRHEDIAVPLPNWDD